MDDSLGREIAGLVGDLRNSPFTTLNVRSGDKSLHLRRPVHASPASAPGPTPPEPLRASEAAPPEEKLPEEAILRSPRVGYFFPRDGEDSELQPGAPLAEGQVYGTIEVMHLKYEVRAEKAGVFQEFLASEGQAVEYGQPLVALRAGQ